MAGRYHLEKQTRLYGGQGYDGHTARQCGYLGPMEFDDLETARKVRLRLQVVNPVGWNIWDSTTRELVEGFDMFEHLK